MKIDVHTHLLPKVIADFKAKFGYGGFIQSPNLNNINEPIKLYKDDGNFFRTVNYNCFDIETRLNEALLNDVSIQVLSTVPVMFSYFAKPNDGLYIAQYLNDDLAYSVSLNKDKLIGLGTLPMQSTKFAVKELERCIKDLKLTGVQIGTHINDINLDNECLYPFYEACQDLNASIFIHPWDMIGQNQMPKYFLPWLVGMPMEISLAINSLIFGGIFAKFPKLKVCFAHGGGSFGFTLGRINHAFHVRPDLCAINIKEEPNSYLHNFYVDSLVHSQESLDFIIKIFGIDYIMTGSDYPFVLGEKYPGKLISENVNLTDNDKAKLLYQNAQRWLSLGV